MRLKKIKNADIIIKKSDYLIDNPTWYKGKWNTVFNNKKNISIEIGMGKGDFIIGMAKMHPDINYVGIEKYDSVIIRAVQKLENEEIPNLRIICFDAADINDVFGKEIDTIYLNFSDPWPKKRHSKRRLTSMEFLKKYDLIFKNNKKIIQKTDNVDLFLYSIDQLSEYGYDLKNITYDLHNDNILENVETEYEKRFVDRGIKICRLEAYKR